MRRWVLVIGIAALVLGLVGLVAWDLVVALNLPDWRDRFRGELLGLLVPLAAAIAGAGALLNFVNSRAGLKETQQQNRDQLELNRRGQLTERFGKAIDQLGQGDAKDRDIRIGGIYALEQIARDSAELHGPVMEVLTAFLREHRPLSGERAPDEAPVKLPADIQAALTVVGRRNANQDQGSMDLRSTDLQGANLSGADLQGADLTEANLHGADLWDADLRGADLGDADLRGAAFGINLQGAHFVGADLQRADFVHANLQGADLGFANLQGAYLGGANLQGASLRGADLQCAYLEGTDLQGADITEANFQGAKVSPKQLAAARPDTGTAFRTPSNRTDNSTEGSVESGC
jgi:uncharacterized protein YjbI with pentapeptide repeats